MLGVLGYCVEMKRTGPGTSSLMYPAALDLAGQSHRTAHLVKQTGKSH